jgi:hypothetical protein
MAVASLRHPFGGENEEKWLAQINNAPIWHFKSFGFPLFINSFSTSNQDLGLIFFINLGSLRENAILGHKKRGIKPLFLHSAEREGFEPPDLLQSIVFKTIAIDHSAISPRQM